MVFVALLGAVAIDSWNCKLYRASCGSDPGVCFNGCWSDFECYPGGSDNWSTFDLNWNFIGDTWAILELVNLVGSNTQNPDL